MSQSSHWTGEDGLHPCSHDVDRAPDRDEIALQGAIIMRESTVDTSHLGQLYQSQMGTPYVRQYQD